MSKRNKPTKLSFEVGFHKVDCTTKDGDCGRGKATGRAAVWTLAEDEVADPPGAFFEAPLLPRFRHESFRVTPPPVTHVQGKQGAARGPNTELRCLPTASRSLPGRGAANSPEAKSASSVASESQRSAKPHPTVQERRHRHSFRMPNIHPSSPENQNAKRATCLRKTQELGSGHVGPCRSQSLE